MSVAGSISGDVAPREVGFNVGTVELALNSGMYVGLCTPRSSSVGLELVDGIREDGKRAVDEREKEESIEVCCDDNDFEMQSTTQGSLPLKLRATIFCFLKCEISCG